MYYCLFWFCTCFCFLRYLYGNHLQEVATCSSHDKMYKLVILQLLYNFLLFLTFFSNFKKIIFKVFNLSISLRGHGDPWWS